MALNKGIWDPKLRGTNINGTNLKSLSLEFRVLCAVPDGRMGTNLMYNMATASTADSETW